MMKLRLLTFCLVLACAVTGQAQSIGSYEVFPPNNPWNTRIDTLPVHPRSDKFIASVGGTIHVHPDFGSNAAYGIPWEAVNGTQPFVPITLDSINGYPDQSDPGQMPIPPSARVEQPPPLSGDGHVLVVDTSNHRLYELYQARKDNNDNGWLASSTAIFALDSNNFRPDGWTSCDAAGLPIFPGLVRMYECQAGEIKHALRFTIPHSSKGYIFPARHYASSNTDTTNVMPMGLRCRLKASFDDSKDTGFAKVIITAMKRYGIIMADNGSSWYVSGENNTSWPDNDINQLKAITGNDFEAVYSGPIRTFPNEFPDPIFPLDTTSTKTTIGKFHITSNPFQFGNVTVGNTDSLTFSMTNTGDGELDISVSNLQGTNADFKLVTPLQLPPFKLAPGGSISATISFTPSGAGVESTSYTLTVTDQPGHSFDTIITLTGVGVSQAGVIGISGQPAQLSIYPNPASKGMAVAMPNQSGSIVIVDALGRTRITGTLRNGIASLDLGNLPNGSYFVRIATKEGVISKPIQVLH